MNHTWILRNVCKVNTNKIYEELVRYCPLILFHVSRYATKGSLNKAIEDFELALENCPTHRNARKYLCQTLVERGGQ